MDNVQDLVSEFSWVNVVTVSMIGNEGNVQRPDVWYQRKSLQKVMLVFVSCSTTYTLCSPTQSL